LKFCSFNVRPLFSSRFSLRLGEHVRDIGPELLPILSVSLREFAKGVVTTHVEAAKGRAK
jgi:hypothetical protein